MPKSTNYWENLGYIIHSKWSEFTEISLPVLQENQFLWEAVNISHEDYRSRVETEHCMMSTFDPAFLSAQKFGAHILRTV